MHLPAKQTAAFTRVELLAGLTGVALILAVVLPALAGNRLQADRLGCVNNLRQLIQAYHLWGNDRGGGMPIRTSTCRGGLYESDCAKPAPRYIDNAWFHFAWISNELVTPRLLACPGDVATLVATDFSTSPDHGFLHPNFRARAVSYTVALDAYPGQVEIFVSSDRNLAFNGVSGGCSSGVRAAASLLYGRDDITNYWDPGPHGQTGNLALYDGRVLQTSSRELHQYLEETLRQQGDNGVFHVLPPRY